MCIYLYYQFIEVRAVEMYVLVLVVPFASVV